MLRRAEAPLRCYVCAPEEPVPGSLGWLHNCSKEGPEGGKTGAGPVGSMGDGENSWKKLVT